MTDTACSSLDGCPSSLGFILSEVPECGQLTRFHKVLHPEAGRELRRGHWRVGLV